MYRLGLDIGANSIGWSALTLVDGAPAALMDAGVRVFPDGRNPKSQQSLAAERRINRGMRRRRDRYLRRRAALLSALQRHGLMPTEAAEGAAIAQLNPYELRAAALHRRLMPHELGRVIFHLNQRRGFRSNRRADRGNEEKGVIGAAAAELSTKLERDGPTLGAWLAARHARGESVRVRLRNGGTREASYDFYPLRDMIAAEFDQVWAAQAAWNSKLSTTARDELRGILLRQRPLKPVMPGRCWLEPDEFRASRALPTTQAFRIAQDLAHLRLQRVGEPDASLSARQRELLANLLLAGQALTFDRIRKLLAPPGDVSFNLERTAKAELKGCETSARLGRKGKPLAAWWATADLQQKDAAVASILDAEQPEQAIAGLTELGIAPRDAELAERVVLAEGHASHSLKAMRRLLPHIEAGARPADAYPAAGYAHHSDDRPDEVLARLPYYGEVLKERLGTGSGNERDRPELRFGRAPNPTVHVALNQLRHVVNAIIERHGPPAEIVVEVLRDLARSAEQRRETTNRHTSNQKENERRRAEIAAVGDRPNFRNLRRMRLWEEQARDPKDRCCPYSGEIISLARLFSDEIEEDHILPFSTTFDDSDNNRILCMRSANRAKKMRTPHEAFGHSPEWPSIAGRAAALPPAKRWRFAPNAMVRWQGSHEGFLDRHLHDSATAARWARLYLRHICDPDRVWTVSGKLTAMFRGALGLNADVVLGRGGNRKDRTDHRHHAIDAIVVALCDRGLIKLASDAARRGAEQDRSFADFPVPWEGFVAECGRVIRAVVVSTKPDASTAGRLHNATNYGPVRNAQEGERNVRHRLAIDVLATRNPSEIREAVADPPLAERIVAARAEGKAALSNLVAPNGSRVRRVRWRERLDKVAALPDPSRRHERLVKLDTNHRADFWRTSGGDVALRVVPMLEAAAEEARARSGLPVTPAQRPHPAAKLIMRLHKGDVVAFGTHDGRRLLTVEQLDPGRLVLADLSAAGSLRDRHRDGKDPFRYVYAVVSAFARNGARKVWIDPSGRLRDPGPLAW